MPTCSDRVTMLFVKFAPKDYTKVTTGPLDSQALVQQPRKAPPMGRALRILLGLVVIVYTVPFYFQVPMRLAVGAWLLVLGLIGIYSLIHIVVSRRIVAFGPISVPRHHFPLQGAPAAASSRGLLRAGVQLLLNKAGEILKPLKGRGGKLTWTGVDQAQRAQATAIGVKNRKPGIEAD